MEWKKGYFIVGGRVFQIHFRQSKSNTNTHTNEPTHLANWEILTHTGDSVHIKNELLHYRDLLTDKDKELLVEFMTTSREVSRNGWDDTKNQVYPYRITDKHSPVYLLLCSNINLEPVDCPESALRKCI